MVAGNPRCTCATRGSTAASQTYEKRMVNISKWYVTSYCHVNVCTSWFEAFSEKASLTAYTLRTREYNINIDNLKHIIDNKLTYVSSLIFAHFVQVFRRAPPLNLKKVVSMKQPFRYYFSRDSKHHSPGRRCLRQPHYNFLAVIHKPIVAACEYR
jgi:hypothetical protein